MLKHSNDTKRIRAIIKCFSFLDGFDVVYERHKKGYSCIFNKNSISIIIKDSGDYRDENRIDFVIKNGTTVLFSFFYKAMLNSNLEYVDKMETAVNSVYQSASGKGFTNNDYLKIIQIYA